MFERLLLIPVLHVYKKTKEKISMAQHIVEGSNSLHTSSTQAPSLHTVLWLRLPCGLTTLLGAIISYFALSWDIQWHTFVGRDRTLTPPHVFLLSGIVVCGIGALIAVIIETLWVKNNQAMEQHSTAFANRFAAPLGIYISGYAALNMAVAFPVDQYWHTLYGVDVSIWAPFHIMAIAGLGLEALGAFYTFVSVAKLSRSLNTVMAKRVAYTGAVVAMATSLAAFSVLAAEGMDTDKFLQLGFISVDIFPMLQGLLLATLLLAIAYALPWKWAATSVVGIIALFMGISQVVVPPALIWLMHAEQLTFLSKVQKSPEAPLFSALALTWPMLSLVSAILIDIFMQMARKQHISEPQLSLMLGGAILIGCLPLTLENPTAILDTIASLNTLGIVLTIALAISGTYIGIQLGQNIGKAISVSER